MENIKQINIKGDSSVNIGAEASNVIYDETTNKSSIDMLNELKENTQNIEEGAEANTIININGKIAPSDSNTKNLNLLGSDIDAGSGSTLTESFTDATETLGKRIMADSETGYSVGSGMEPVRIVEGVPARAQNFYSDYPFIEMFSLKVPMKDFLIKGNPSGEQYSFNTELDMSTSLGSCYGDGIYICYEIDGNKNEYYKVGNTYGTLHSLDDLSNYVIKDCIYNKTTKDFLFLLKYSSKNTYCIKKYRKNNNNDLISVSEEEYISSQENSDEIFRIYYFNDILYYFKKSSNTLIEIGKLENDEYIIISSNLSIGINNKFKITSGRMNRENYLLFISGSSGIYRIQNSVIKISNRANIDNICIGSECIFIHDGNNNKIYKSFNNGNSWVNDNATSTFSKICVFEYINNALIFSYGNNYSFALSLDNGYSIADLFMRPGAEETLTTYSIGNGGVFFNQIYDNKLYYCYTPFFLIKCNLFDIGNSISDMLLYTEDL